MYYFGKSEENMDLSRIYLAVLSPCHAHIFITRGLGEKEKNCWKIEGRIRISRMVILLGNAEMYFGFFQRGSSIRTLALCPTSDA